MTYQKFVNNLSVLQTMQSCLSMLSVTICDEDHKALQLGLNALQDWSNKWLVKLNILKCKIVFFGRNIIKIIVSE